MLSYIITAVLFFNLGFLAAAFFAGAREVN